MGSNEIAIRKPNPKEMGPKEIKRQPSKSMYYCGPIHRTMSSGMSYEPRHPWFFHDKFSLIQQDFGSNKHLSILKPQNGGFFDNLKFFETFTKLPKKFKIVKMGEY